MPNRTRQKPTPLAVCFLGQNPISLNFLTQLLPRREFRVLDEHEATEPHSRGRLVFVVDEKILAQPGRLTLRSLRVCLPGAKLLVLANHLPAGEQYRQLQGIDGLVLYAEAKTKLLPALRALRDGHLWLPPEVLEHFARQAVEAGEGRNGQFTPREGETVRLIAEGLSNKEIGTRLGIAEKTVKFHASNAFAKLGVHDRNSAVEAIHARPALS